jgi:two-component system, OmpR family, phosphate regulon sensor histidine kinase PhoR
MARQLAVHIQAVEQQRNEQQAVLSSMIESVVAIDTQLRIITINDAASALLGVRAKDLKGRTLIEAVRSTALHAFARRALASDGVVQGEVAFGGPPPVLLRAHGTVLQDVAGKSMGAVIVLENITRLRKLEEVRQDFVANVSHELKTPITSIKGFVETLLENRDAPPDTMRHFLEIVGKQANRLDAIIDDLLTLSRLEQDTERSTVSLAETPVLPTVEAAAELCQHRADNRGVRITVACPEGLSAPINAPLLEQGLVNLIDNAVKYSEAGQEVAVHAFEDGGSLVIDVTDTGAGIPANEVNRIFERFYRVDRARSRDMGGTGLGLSIVKHIAQVHGGTVTVRSAPGEGSTFSIRIPLNLG